MIRAFEPLLKVVALDVYTADSISDSSAAGESEIESQKRKIITAIPIESIGRL